MRTPHIVLLFGAGAAGALVMVLLSGIIFFSIPDEALQRLITAARPAVPESEDAHIASTLRTVPEVVEQVIPSVVSVVVTKDVPIYERYYEEWNPFGGWGGGFQVPRVREQGTEEREVGGGSGFVVSGDGLIVTNRHVVDDREARYSIITNDGDSFEVEVLARDPQLDIAVLKLTEPPAEPLPHLGFGDSEALHLGETVVAIGNALAEFRNSVSVGVISGLSRSIVASDSQGRSEALSDVIQTDAAINPGNSGGPLLNLRGEVVGVNVATSQGADNIGFALPAHVVRSVVESVAATGEISRPFLGVRYVMINEEIKELNALTVDYGALIVRGERREELAVMPGSPADKAGVRENDIILAIDGEELSDNDLSAILRQKAIDSTVTLRLLSQGEEREVRVVLTAAPE